MGLDSFEPLGFFGGPSVHTLRIELLDVKPKVWRRLVVPSDTKLPKFSRMLEAAMGWQGYHMHMFEIEHLQIGQPDEDFDTIIHERNITVNQLLRHQESQVRWVYDFGDYWEHDVLVETIEGLEPEVRYPMCVDGEQACPPEDCGGSGGYAELRRVLADPADPEHELLREWAGDDFDPTVFEADTATKRLHKVR